MSAILAIDLGGTRCRIGFAQSADPAAVKLVDDVPAPPSREDFVGLVAQRLKAHEASRLGLGIPGLAQGSICRWVPNLSYLDGLDLEVAFPDVTVGLGNDAQLSLLAEMHTGAARDMKDAVLLAIGTGIGSAVLASGTIISGQGGGACSFGWATAALDDAGENTSGWLERQAAGRTLDRAAARLGLTDGKALIGEARAGKAEAAAALERPMHALGTAIGAAVALLDPSAIIIAGGVADAFDVIGPMLRRHVDRCIPPHLRGVRIVPAVHGSKAGLVGAAFAGALGASWRRTA